MKINIASFWDPLSPKSWSGTPYNICRELQRINLLGDCIESGRLDRYAKKALTLLSSFYYGSSHYMERGALLRYARSYTVRKRIERNRGETQHTLHLGTLDLPFLRLTENQKHYLFCDTTWNLWARHSTEMSGFKGRLLRDAESLDKKAYHQMSHIFSISNYVKENLISHYGIRPERISVVGTGRGIVKAYYGKKDYTNGHILFAAKGRFEDKGGKLVLEGFKIANRSNPKLSLIIVGADNYKKTIPGIPNTTVYGFVSVEKLQELFDTSSLFVMPAINEPWGLVYLEALSCRIPIIGLNRNSFPEISQNGRYGFILDNENPEQLADIILRAYKNPEQLENMGLQGQGYCLSNFSWEKTVKIIADTILNDRQTNRG